MRLERTPTPSPVSRRAVMAGLSATAVVAACRGSRDGAPGDEVQRPATAAASPPGPGELAATAPAPIRRPIPSSGELVPAIGLGSARTFDVDPERTADLRPVMHRFLAGGGRVVDSSPMYGQAEAAIGRMLRELRAADPATPSPFLATKVWTEGKAEGVTQMRRSFERLGVTTIDLMQVHNLVDWRTHLATLRAWKEAGTVRYIGVTHYSRGAFDEMERIIRHESIDFVQLPYSVIDREAERRLLPAAAEAGVAVVCMEPFDRGQVFARVEGRPLPPWAGDLDCTSWAQLFLKWLLGHPAVTCPIPATTKVTHVEDNLGAMFGRVPDQSQRAAIVAAFEA